MSDPKQILSNAEVNQAKLGWEISTDTIHATFNSGDFATGLKFVNAIGDSAEQANHHPDILLTYPNVEVTLSSHDVGGLTSRDIDLAQLINEHAEKLGFGIDGNS